MLVVGYGTEGRAAVDTLLARDVQPADLTVVDLNRNRTEDASAQGIVTFPVMQRGSPSCAVPAWPTRRRSWWR